MKTTNSPKLFFNHSTLLAFSKSECAKTGWRAVFKGSFLSRRLICAGLLIQIGMPVLRVEAQEAAAFCRNAEEVRILVSSINKLEFKQDVSCVVQNRHEVENYLRRLVRRQVPAERLKAEEFVYQVIGLIPKDFDYEQGLINLYLSQLGGYYDPEGKLLVMADWQPLSLQKGIMVHELTHALQDQHYDLRAFINLKIENGDLLLARAALAEGHAAAVAEDYFEAAGGKLLLEEGGRRNIHTTRTGLELYTLDVALPLSLRLLASFPYTHGLRFVKGLLRKDGYAEVKRAYARPPRSSEEILHPEKYFARHLDFTEFEDEQVLKCNERGDWVVKYRETMGEYAITALFLSLLEDQDAALQAAEGWDGDRLVLVEAHGVGRAVIWLSRWDSETDAREFLELYLKSLKKRLPKDGRQGGLDAGVWGWLDEKSALYFKRLGRQVCLNFQLAA